MSTIRDVARVSGVSIATVSQVLNNGGRPVNSTTRERVREAANQLQYRPNALARGLINKRMNTIGLVLLHARLSSQTNPFLTAVLDGVLSVNTLREQTTTLYTITRWEHTREHLSKICDRRCDGVILVVPPLDCLLPQALSQAGLPYVIASGKDPSAQAAGVDIDNVHAASQMTDYLLRLGHRRIAFVHQEQEWAFPFVQERHQGYRQTMETWGTYDPSLANLLVPDAIEAAQSGSSRPTALFCDYDANALDVIRQLQRHGLRVPEDISVVGFDDIPSAALSWPSLTTVHQPAVHIGERAAEMLLDLIEGIGQPGQQQTIATELAIRQSAAPPRI
jgi:LacI family transcriptional regulator